MLDLKTVVVFLIASASIDGLVGLVVWGTYRHLDGLNAFSRAYIVLALSNLLLVSSSTLITPTLITVYNVLVHQCLVLAAVGIARFLGQPCWRYLSPFAFVYTLAIWPAAFHWAPGNISIRIIASALLTVLILGHLLRSIMADRSMSYQLRWFGMLVVGGQAALTAARAIHSAVDFHQPGFKAGNMVQSWFLAETGLFSNLLFLHVFLMVAARLTNDLWVLNRDLSDEIAERRKLQKKLSSSLRMEKRLRNEQKQFLSVVGHELRTPLAIIGRSAEMVGALIADPPEAVASRLTNIHEAVNRLVQLIDHLLITERAEQTPLRTETIDAGGLIEAVARSFAGLCAPRRLRLRLPPEAVVLTGDRQMLTVVLRNLIDNALKYSPADFPVTVTLERRSSTARITVEDCGLGIPPGELARIGQRFFRASNAKEFSGTGLGLFAARQLTAYHRGTIKIDSTPGRGTAVTLAMPCRPSELVPGDDYEQDLRCRG